jgi:hypothetical protein
MTPNNKDDDKKEWIKKKQPIVENIEETIKLNEEALATTSKAKADVTKSTEQLKNNIARLSQIRDLFKSEAYLPINPVTASSIDSMRNLSISEKESARNVLSAAQRVRNESNTLTGTMYTSTAVLVTMTSGSAYMSKQMSGTESISSTIAGINVPTPNDRKSELSPKLKALDVGLATKLEGAWQTINDETNHDRYSQAAHSARELISDILRILAPDDKVKSMRWFKIETREGNPSQRQRAKYAMVGSNDLLSDEVLKPIEDLSRNIRDSYEWLNEIAHQRDYTKDLQALTESIIDEVQIYLLELWRLRTRYFIE